MIRRAAPLASMYPECDNSARTPPTTPDVDLYLPLILHSAVSSTRYRDKHDA